MTLIGQGEQCGQLFYSMELIEGESLQQKLRREKRLPWPEVLDMAIDICAALKHAHDFGAIHRDLKPANLLIDQNGVVKLVDFGVAKLFGSHDQTAAGSILGTADYMAPEQAAGQPVTPRTDLYALGNVLYACFTGRPPFANRSLTEVLEALKNEQPVRVDAIVPELPAEIAELIHDLLEKQPEDRPPTALAVMNRLKAIRAGLNRTATAESVPDSDTIGPQIATPTFPLEPRVDAGDQVTAATDGDSKTLGQFEEGPSEENQGTHPSLPQSEQLTDKVTVASKATRASEPEMAVSRSDEPQSPIPRTHFRTIQDKDRHRSIWGHELQDEESNHFWHIVSVVALLAALTVAIGTGIWLMRPPTADELFAAITAAEAKDDTTTTRNKSEQFVKLYQDDPRAPQVYQRWKELEIQRKAGNVISTLMADANKLDAFASMSLAEQAIVEAVREPDNATQIQRLEYWLAVFGNQQPVENENAENETVDVKQGERSRASMQVLTAAVKEQLQKLRSRLAKVEADHVSDLEQRMRWAQENLAPEQERQLLQGIVALYADRSWAQGVITRAQQRLNELGKSG